MRNKALAIAIAAIAASTLVAWSAVPDEAASATFVYGTPALESIGAIAFGPDNVLFVGDSQGAAVYAVDIRDDGVWLGPPKLEKPPAPDEEDWESFDPDRHLKKKPAED